MWCEQHGLPLAETRPFNVAVYVEELQREVRAPSVKQQLAAIRMLCDWLAAGQMMPSNPASSVRGPRHVVKTGKTPVLEGVEWRRLMDTIPEDSVRSPQFLRDSRIQLSTSTGVGAWGRGVVWSDQSGYVACMPFKHNAARRYRFPKQRWRVTNWPFYEAARRRRGDLTIWLDEAALFSWNAPRRTTRGGQSLYSNAAIELVLTLRLVFHLALR